MKLSFDFERGQPPRITEEMLVETLHSRQLVKRTLLLMVASMLIHLSLALLAFAVAPFSLEAGIACLVLLGISLANSGIIAVIFAKKWFPQVQSKSSWLQEPGI